MLAFENHFVDDCAPQRALLTSTTEMDNLMVYRKNVFTKTPEKESWKKFPTNSIKLILKSPTQCKLDLADQKMVTTMHAFMGGSSTYCMI